MGSEMCTRDRPSAPSGSFTLTNSNKDAEWTVSGAAYGNGTYKAKSNVDVHVGSRIYHAGSMFDYNISDYYEYHTASSAWTNNSGSTVDLDIEFPTSFVLSSYGLTVAPYTVSGYEPTNWTILGSSDGTTWSSAIDTQTGRTGDGLYILTGNTTAYKHYRLSVSSTYNGNHCVVRELRYYQSSSTEPIVTRWSEQAKIQASDKEANDNFGGFDPAVSISGDTAVVGAFQEDTGGSNAGAAYVFERSGTTWTEVKLSLIHI